MNFIVAIGPTNTPILTPTATPTPTVVVPPPLGDWRQSWGGSVYQPKVNLTMPDDNSKFYLMNKTGESKSSGVVYAQGAPDINIYPTSMANNYSESSFKAAQTPVNNYNYAYFLAQAKKQSSYQEFGGSTLFTNTTYSYNYYSTPGDHTLGAGAITGNDGVSVYIINGNLNITSDITLSPGTMTAAFIASGNITVLGTVNNLKGVYYAEDDVTFYPGAGPININGLLYANTITENRVSADVNNPTYRYTYEPGMILPLYNSLGKTQVSWQEVAP